MSTSKRRKRRSPEEKIQDLRAEIARLEAQKKTKNSEARKKAKASLKGLSKAAELAQEEGDGELLKGLERSMRALEACLGAGGGGGGRIRRTNAELEALGGQVLGFLADNAKVSISEIAEALGDSTKDIRPVLMGHLENSLVKKEGERRGTRYTITAKGRKKA